jgi:hypothetical protein
LNSLRFCILPDFRDSGGGRYFRYPLSHSALVLLQVEHIAIVWLVCKFYTIFNTYESYFVFLQASVLFYYYNRISAPQRDLNLT